MMKLLCVAARFSVFGNLFFRKIQLSIGFHETNEQHLLPVMIQDTSLHAYALATQNLGAKQKQVLDALRFFPDATNRELKEYLHREINSVTPSIGELRGQGLVIDAGIRACKHTGRRVHAWRAKHPVLPPAYEQAPKQTNALFE
jgi:hypothetical protein